MDAEQGNDTLQNFMKAVAIKREREQEKGGQMGDSRRDFYHEEGDQKLVQKKSHIFLFLS